MVFRASPKSNSVSRSFDESCALKTELDSPAVAPKPIFRPIIQANQSLDTTFQLLEELRLRLIPVSTGRPESCDSDEKAQTTETEYEIEMRGLLRRIESANSYLGGILEDLRV